MALYTVFYEWAGDPDARLPVRPQHQEFLAKLVERGVLLVSGPLNGRDSGAMFILSSSSAEAAARELSSDPFQVGGFVSNVRVSQWTPMSGPLVGVLQDHEI